MPRTTIEEIPPAEQARMRAELCRARYRYLLAVPVLLLFVAQQMIRPYSYYRRG